MAWKLLWNPRTWKDDESKPKLKELEELEDMITKMLEVRQIDIMLRFVLSQRCAYVSVELNYLLSASAGQNL